MIAFFSLFIACQEKTTDTATTETTDTTSEISEGSSEGSTGSTGSSEAPEIEGELDTIEEYVASYCGEYATRCGLYSSVDSCYEDIFGSWFNGCTVTNTDNLKTCVDWLSELDCSEEGWIDACDNFYTCD